MAGVRFDVSHILLSALCNVLIAEQIGVLSKGFLMGQSTLGRLILLEFGKARVRLALTFPSLWILLLLLWFILHACLLLIWVKYSQRTTKLLK